VPIGLTTSRCVDETGTELVLPAADRLSSALRDAHAHFEQSPIRDIVLLLVERRAGLS